MNAPATDQELLHQAIQTLGETTGLKLGVAQVEIAQEQDGYIDAFIELQVGEVRKTYAAEIKRYLTLARIGLAAEQLRKAPYPGLLVADYVNPNLADHLREIGLPFIDLAGNAYLDEPPVYVFIKGNRPANKDAYKQTFKPTRAFQPTGLKMLFTLLTHPAYLAKPYREIAELTDVALGTVGWVLTDLREHGFIYEKKNRQRKFARRKDLIEQWVTAYPEKLRPKLLLGRYRAPAHDWWRHAAAMPYGTQWGGEVAAAKLTDYLVPDHTVIYADTLPTRFLAENELKVDKAGDVEVLKRFWNEDRWANELGDAPTPTDIVPALLVYADLMATADERNIETASLVYREYLDGHIE